MEDREFYKQFQTLHGEGFLLRSRRDIKGSRGIAIGGLGLALVGIFFFAGFVGQALLALGFAFLGGAAAVNVSIQKRVAVWPLIDAVIDWKKVDEQIGNSSQTEHRSSMRAVSDGVSD
jgi:hypothetical protein